MDPAPDATLGDMIMAGRRAVAGLGDTVSVPWRGLKFKKPWTPCPVEALTFVGHYWLDEDEAGPLTDMLAALTAALLEAAHYARTGTSRDEGRWIRRRS